MSGVISLPMLTHTEMNNPSAIRLSVNDAADEAAERGVESIVLGGAIFAGLPRSQQRGCSIPLIDGVAAGVKMAESLVSLDIPKAKKGSYRQPDQKIMSNVSQELADYFDSL